MTGRLTVVLPLKGRELFTLRFLWHANVARVNCRFIVADGWVNQKLAELLENSRSLFPNIDVEYLRYPPDERFSDYFAKMADAIGRVSTPYVMLADNDDFLAPAGLEQSMDFLDAHPDYVCCGGGIAGFSVYSRNDSSFGGVVGPINKLAYRYMPYDRSSDFASPGVTARVAAGLRNSWSYYAVFRTPSLKTIWDEINCMKPSDLQIVEKYCAMRTLTLGKARSDRATIAYCRQYWTTLNSAFGKDWVHHLLRSRFTTDLDNAVERVASAAAAVDGLDNEQVTEVVKQGIEPWLRDFLRLNYGLSASVRGRLRTHMPALLRWMKTRRRFSVPRERRALLSKLRGDGASEAYIEALRAELRTIEDVVNGQAFRRFLHAHAQSLIAAPAV